jgi:hypothetical protein
MLSICQISFLLKVWMEWLQKEAWNERKPNATHLKVFESISYVLVDDQVRTKLDDKSKMMIFVGYD